MKGRELLAELNKNEYRIKELLESYDYSEYIDISLIIEKLRYTFNVPVRTPQATIINFLELYVFLEENDEITLNSNSSMSKIKIDLFTTIPLLTLLSKLIQKYIVELEQAHPFMEKIYAKYKTKEITFQMYLSFFRSTYVDECKYTVFNEETALISMYKMFKNAGLFTSDKVNQKGTTKLSNRDGAFLYDMLLIIRDEEINDILTDKEKSDYIRYRLEKLKLT